MNTELKYENGEIVATVTDEAGNTGEASEDLAIHMAKYPELSADEKMINGTLSAVRLATIHAEQLYALNSIEPGTIDDDPGTVTKPCGAKVRVV